MDVKHKMPIYILSGKLRQHPRRRSFGNCTMSSCTSSFNGVLLMGIKSAPSLFITVLYSGHLSNLIKLSFLIVCRQIIQSRELDRSSSHKHFYSTCHARNSIYVNYLSFERLSAQIELATNTLTHFQLSPKHSIPFKFFELIFSYFKSFSDAILPLSPDSTRKLCNWTGSVLTINCHGGPNQPWYSTVRICLESFEEESYWTKPHSHLSVKANICCPMTFGMFCLPFTLRSLRIYYHWL